ncbi:MAG: type I restriction-modification system subunit M [Candidatus Methanomethylophilaceae archaeon]|nr:type I restriction-modification system subunit M [Candidatus Methanomethylophilaceae archaeon]
MSKVTQEQINAIAWKACDTFRGVVDPSEYKNYILTFLFIKYLSDVWKDKAGQYREQYGDNQLRIDRALQRERFQMPVESTYDYLYQHRNATNIGELINIALTKLQDANRGKLDGVFRDIDFNSSRNLGDTKERNVRLKHLIEDFSSADMDLRPSKVGNGDIIGNVYEYLIANFASDSGKKGGEFYTPAEVSELIAMLVQPKPGNRLYDPACGSGSLLIKVARQVGGEDYSIYGQEVNGNTYALCRMNMFLHGIDNARIEWGDTIRNPKVLEGDHLMKFDIVVANPPFSLDKWGFDFAGTDPYNRFWRGIPPKSTGDFAFITHMIESTVPATGKVGVVVPHGVLFRGGAEGRIRQRLIEENLLEAVIGLPAKLFFGTGIPAAILVFNRGKQTSDVLFIDASREYQEGKNQNRLRPEDQQRVLDTYKEFSTVDKYSYRATVDEIRENAFNLNIPRYVDTFEEEEEIDINKLVQEIAVTNNELSYLEERMKQYLTDLGLTISD